MKVPTITIDLKKKCSECGKVGAAESGVCMTCAIKAVCGETMKSASGRAVQKRFNENKSKP